MGRSNGGGNQPFYHQPGFNDSMWSEEQLNDLADEMKQWANDLKRYNSPIIFSEFAVDHDMSRQQLYAYCKKNAKLDKARKYAKSAQNAVMIKGALLKDSGFNANFVQFLLTHNDDYTPKQSIQKDTSQDSAKAAIKNLVEAVQESVEEKRRSKR